MSLAEFCKVQGQEFVGRSEMAISYTDRAVLWCQAVSSIARTQQTSNLHDSIHSVSLQLRNAAFILVHDGSISCSDAAAVDDHALPCEELVRNGSSWEEAGCYVGPKQLQPRHLYLMAVARDEQEAIQQLRNDLFSYRTCNCTRRQVWTRREVLQKARTELSQGPSAASYGERIGLGAWYRYLAPKLLLPVGIRYALYLDADTCAVGKISDLFSVARNVSSPLVVARREAPWTLMKQRLQASFFDTALGSKHYKFPGYGPKLLNAMFNNGVMLINLLQFCAKGLWEQMQGLARHHAMRSRVWGPLDAIKEFGDNQVIEVVGAAHSHHVGAEWNCRHYSSLRTLKTQGNVRCRIRHLHEDELIKQMRTQVGALHGVKTCKDLIRRTLVRRSGI